MNRRCGLIRSVTVPHPGAGQGSSDDLAAMAATVAEALPDGACRRLPGEWHGVPDDVLAPGLAEFLRGCGRVSPGVAAQAGSISRRPPWSSPGWATGPAWP